MTSASSAQLRRGSGGRDRNGDRAAGKGPGTGCAFGTGRSGFRALSRTHATGRGGGVQGSGQAGSNRRFLAGEGREPIPERLEGCGFGATRLLPVTRNL